MMDAEVIQLDAFRGKPRKKIGSQSEPIFSALDDEPETPRQRRMRERQEQEPATVTARNLRARRDLRWDWWAADARTDYWRCMFKLEDAIRDLQRHDLPEGKAYKERDFQSREAMLHNYRVALGAQLLTRSPDASRVTWKRAKLQAGDHKYTGVTPERLQQAIDADVEYLKSHPTRRGGRKSKEY